MKYNNLTRKHGKWTRIHQPQSTSTGGNAEIQTNWPMASDCIEKIPGHWGASDLPALSRWIIISGTWIIFLVVQILYTKSWMSSTPPLAQRAFNVLARFRIFPRDMIRAILSLLLVQWPALAASCSANESYALLQTKSVRLNEKITQDIFRGFSRWKTFLQRARLKFVGGPWTQKVWRPPPRDLFGNFCLEV